MSEQETQPRKSKQHRSPTYPSIDLAAALIRAEQLYRAENRHFAPVSAVLEAWGYSPKSSGGKLAVAALKRYGLLEDRGSLEGREGRITDLAQAIILDQREESSERIERIREAALNVPVIREILEKYKGDLPSDATLKYHLSVERGFSPGGAREFIDVLRKTLAFAQLPLRSDTVLDDEGDSETADDELAPEGVVERSEPIRSSQRVSPSPIRSALVVRAGAPAPIQFPVAGGATVTLQSTAPLSEVAWDQMMTVLKALKSAIVTGEPAAQINASFAVGDRVDWESQGVLHGAGLIVREVSSDGDYVFVEGSDTGIPSGQLSRS